MKLPGKAGGAIVELRQVRAGNRQEQIASFRLRGGGNEQSGWKAKQEDSQWQPSKEGPHNDANLHENLELRLGAGVAVVSKYRGKSISEGTCYYGNFTVAGQVLGPRHKFFEFPLRPSGIIEQNLWFAEQWWWQVSRSCCQASYFYTFNILFPLLLVYYLED